MKTITTTAIVLSLAVVAVSAMAVLPEPEDGSTLAASTATGENSGCLDYLVLWIANGQHSPVGDSEKIDDVEPDSGWEATSDEGTVWVDFFDEGGAHLHGGPESGTVPEDADYAYGCVTLTGDYPDLPVPGASFTYEDGL